jgi:hypothetical protein
MRRRLSREEGECWVFGQPQPLRSRELDGQWCDYWEAKGEGQG